MSAIATASETRALSDKQALARLVLSDIARAVATIGGVGREASLTALRALRARLEVLPARAAGRVVGPELFRWLAEVSWADRCGDVALLRASVRRLPAMLVGRLIAVATDADVFAMPGWGSSEPGGPGTDGDPEASGLRVPQAELEVPLVDPRQPFEIGARALRQGERRHPLAPVRARIDGATDQGPSLAGSSAFFHQRGDELHAMLRELNEVASAPVGADEALTVIADEHLRSRPRERRILDTMARGRALLGDSAPDLHREVMAVLDGITLVTGRRFVGGSDIWYHGIAVLNPDEDWSPTTYADHLVHEGAHIALHAHNELTPLLVNADQYGAPSPIREDPRPLYGILHSTFVFGRLVQLFMAAAPRIDSDEGWFRLHRHLKGFYEGLDILLDYADPTAAGLRLLREMVALRAAWWQTLPRPDPRFYLRVGKDYVV